MFSMGISARIVKRIITLLIVTLGVVTLSFCLQIFTGTDPAEMLVRKTTLFATEEQIQAMRVELGLDGTLSEQYADYMVIIKFLLRNGIIWKNFVVTMGF